MTEQLRVGGVPEHFNLPWKLAIVDGAFARVGFDVTFVEQPGGTGAMTAALGNDELDVALVLTEGAVLDIVNGGANRLVSVWVDSPIVWGIHVAADGPVHSIGDIEGKRIAISRYGSGSHLISIVDAAERGFETRGMRFVVVENIDGARKALADGDADVFLWERHMTQPLVDSGEFRRVGERAVPWPAFVVSVRRRLLPAHEEQIRTALTVARDYANILRQDSGAAGLISETYGIKEQDARNWLEGVQWSQDFACPEPAIRRVLDALLAQGAIESQDIGLDTIWHELAG